LNRLLSRWNQLSDLWGSPAALCLAFGITLHNCPAAALVVHSNRDDGSPDTLRNALANAANGDTIDASGISGVITLTNGELFVGNSITITGPGPSNLAVRGSDGRPVFTILADNPVTISGLTITPFSTPGINPSYVGRGI